MTKIIKIKWHFETNIKDRGHFDTNTKIGGILTLKRMEKLHTLTKGVKRHTCQSLEDTTCTFQSSGGQLDTSDKVQGEFLKIFHNFIIKKKKSRKAIHIFQFDGISYNRIDNEVSNNAIVNGQMIYRLTDTSSMCKML